MMAVCLSNQDRVLFSSSPKNLLFTGIFLSSRFWHISRYLLACFPGLANQHHTEGSNPVLPANK
jgi:hypothetical protein